MKKRKKKKRAVRDTELRMNLRFFPQESVPVWEVIIFSVSCSFTEECFMEVEMKKLAIQPLIHIFIVL